MDKQSRIMGIAQRLQQASSHRDWTELKRVDAELSARLKVWAELGSGDWTIAERLALDKLRLIHQAVRSQCGNEAQTMSQLLTRIGNQQNRWQAYAQSSNWGAGR